jgi:peptidoglycan hydrolase-like protein with peptidoglycan-binding domain
MYYFKGRDQLVLDPAYVGALQTTLRRLGYYCGPVDGVFTAEVSYAIARLQKNYSMRVTGTLTTPVRRALHLP